MNNFWTDYPKFLPPDLGRMRNTLERLGNPHLKLPPVIHVAGTNGKGSVVENLRAILTQAGHSCHIYSSPHLLRLNERIKISGSEISDEAFEVFRHQVDEAANEIELVWFEVLTCIAFLAFSKAPADYTLLETGLGGRFDATNVVTPILSLITSISMDHQAQLGNSLEAIIYEKAGIVKEGVPVIVGPNTEEVQHFLKSYTPQFCGFPADDYRKDNQDLARAAARYLEIENEIIEEGLSKAAIPGRFQQLADNIYIDGAHNEGGALALNKLLSDFDKPVSLVVVMNRRKDIKAFLTAFQGKVKTIFLPAMASENFYNPENIVVVAGEMGFAVEKVESLEKVYMKAQADTSHIYLFTGSLHFVGEMLSSLLLQG